MVSWLYGQLQIKLEVGTAYFMTSRKKKEKVKKSRGKDHPPKACPQ